MALPTIPTSFVPHQMPAARGRFDSHAVNVFGIFTYIALALAVISAIGVFGYGRILDASQASKEAELAKAEASIDASTIEGFVRLRDRLDSSNTLLAQHTAFSNFFTLLQTLLPQAVRFTSLHIALDASTGTVVTEGTGVAKNFNALASASEAFGNDPRIKNVIFSKISIDKTKRTVSFGFSATLDPKLIAYSSETVVPVAPATPTTSATTSVQVEFVAPQTAPSTTP